MAVRHDRPAANFLRSAWPFAGSQGNRSKPSLEARQIPGNSPPRCAFHASIVMDHFCAELGERRGPAAAAAQRRTDHRVSKHRVHAVNEQPRGSIRHLHPARGFADRSAVADRFQKRDFSGPKRTIGGQIEPKEHACHIPHGATMVRSSRGWARVNTFAHVNTPDDGRDSHHWVDMSARSSSHEY
jgi:hypothetical protein